MTTEAAAPVPPPRRPLGVQRRRLAALAFLLGALALFLALPFEGPFSRIYDNSEPGWLAASALVPAPDGSPVLVLADGTSYRLQTEDGEPIRETPWWAHRLTGYSRGTTVFVESGPEVGPRTVMNVWVPLRTCGTGVMRWNPFPDEPLYSRVDRVRAEVVARQP